MKIINRRWKSMNYFEVFIPGGVPTYTYNPRDSYYLEERIKQAKKEFVN